MNICLNIHLLKCRSVKYCLAGETTKRSIIEQPGANIISYDGLPLLVQ